VAPLANAEAVSSVFKAQLIRNKDPWHGIDNLYRAFTQPGARKFSQDEMTPAARCALPPPAAVD